MTHPSLDELWLLVHDSLDVDEARAVRAHLDAGCASCATALADAQRASDTLSFDAAAREPSAAVRERLLARADGRATQPIEPARSWRIPMSIAAGLVGVGIALGAGATWFAAVSPQAERLAAADRAADEALRERILALRERDLALAARDARVEDPSIQSEREALLAQLAIERGAAADARALAEQLQAENRSLGRSLARVEDRLADREAVTARLAAERTQLDLALQAADDALSLLKAPGVEWVVLSGEGDGAESAARFFWEWDRGDCLIDGGDLPGVAQGQAYALWVAYERGDPVLVATFAPDSEGSARLLAPLPAGEGEVRSVRITLEEAVAPIAPEGETLLAGVLF